MLVLFIQPSFTAAKGVFSLLQNSFTKQQSSSLEDKKIETSIVTELIFLNFDGNNGTIFGNRNILGEILNREIGKEENSRTGPYHQAGHTEHAHHGHFYDAHAQ